MADVQALVDQYKVQFTKASEKLMEQYNNAPQKIEEIKQKVTELQPTVQSWVESTQNNVKSVLSDMAPVGVDMGFHKTILEIYTLAGVGLLASAVGQFVGRAFLGSLVQMFFSENYAAALALVILPWATVYTLQKKPDLQKEDRTTFVIGSSFASGVLIGWLMSERYLPMTPPIFLLPLAIGIGSVFVGPSMGSQPRSNYVGALLGSALGVYMVLGLVTGNLSGGYFIWMTLLSTVAFAEYQFKLSRLYEGSASLAADAAITAAIYSATGFSLFFLFGTSSPPSD